MGSIGVAAWIAKLAFVGLLITGRMNGALGVRGLVVFLVLGAVAWFGLSSFEWGRDYVTSVLAVIDIALVFTIFKGDVRIT